jgi:hypothetical protein
MPVERLENGSWPHPERLPLGCGWNGHCSAPGHEDQPPPQGILEAFCNLGYASSCDWAPRERQSDAVRFAVAAPSRKNLPHEDLHGQGAEELSHIIRVRYVCERDHRPVAQGELEFDLEQSRWARQHGDLRVQKMAECFLESYLKKRS